MSSVHGKNQVLAETSANKAVTKNKLVRLGSCTAPKLEQLTIASLFSGVGGIELGLSRAGFKAKFFCEFIPEARRVLAAHFPSTVIRTDIRHLAESAAFTLPDVGLVTAGFPCQDLSQCGRTSGIFGRQSGLVKCVFELLARNSASPEWLLIENVPFMLRLDRGKAMRHVTESLESLGFTWAYRVIDARCFGLPQRRERVILLASRRHDPAAVLFGSSVDALPPACDKDDRPRGFYWTEGNTGLGWAIDCVPTLKAGSTIGIPSPPAIWLPAYDAVVTPTIEDVESFQGFPRGWTKPAERVSGVSERARWRLVGNAVPVPIAEWIGRQLLDPPNHIAGSIEPLKFKDAWPPAAFGKDGKRFEVLISTWPVRKPWKGLAARYGDTGKQLLARPPLSLRATAGFYKRIKASGLRTDPRFVPSLARFLAHQEAASTS
jgi:DNA (cytosine-5)-methyltransferase 1